MDVGHIPAVTLESFRHVLAEGEIGLTFNGDLIVVVEPAQVRKLQMSGERGSLRRDTFHQVTVAAEGPDMVTKKVKSGTIEMCSQPFPGDRHADAVADALAERAGRRFDARGQAIFRMSRSLAINLAEALEVVNRERRLWENLTFRIRGAYAGQVDQRVQQHRGVAVRQHEAVAVWP